YVLSFAGKTVDVANLNTHALETSIPVPSSPLAVGQVDAIVTAPDIATGDQGEFFLFSATDAPTGNRVLRVGMIDASPTSKNFNTASRNLAASSGTNTVPGALAVTSDGKFAYANDANTGDIWILDLNARTFTRIAAATLNDAPFQGHIEI